MQAHERLEGRTVSQVVFEKSEGVLRIFLHDGSEVKIQAQVNVKADGDPGVSAGLEISYMSD